MKKFKVGDKVRIKSDNGSLNAYLKRINTPTDSIFTIERLLPFSFGYDAYTQGSHHSYRFYEREIELCVEDNSMTRLLYPELKPDGKGYLV